MEFKILASTSTENNNIKSRYNKLSGELAGICYMQGDFESIQNQTDEKKLSRAEMIKENGHHSVFDHEFVTLYFEDVPKLFAMLLNNERVYATSEKSARYTKMNVAGKEKELYDKWLGIMKAVITERYGKEKYFTAKRIEKLAQENARYFISIYTPTSLAYTVSYRQLNYLYTELKNCLKSSNPYIAKMSDTIMNFCNFLEKNDLIDEKIANFAQNKAISLFARKKRKEYFGDTYCTNYTGSFAMLAQAQRHRSLCYEFYDTDEIGFYVPEIIAKNDKLKQMWLEDMMSVASLCPQGKLINICARGLPENFLLKANERLCTCAQLEVCVQTKKTLLKYIAKTDDEEIRQLLTEKDKGARCLTGYKCANPCGFKEGINLTREI